MEILGKLPCCKLDFYCWVFFGLFVWGLFDCFGLGFFKCLIVCFVLITLPKRSATFY